MTERAELDELRAAGRNLVRAIDDMHRRGKTFTARVSIATGALRRLLAPTWPKDVRDENQPHAYGEKGSGE